MPNARIRLEMSIPDVLYALSEGNPGALTVCLGMLKDGEAIDPDAALGSLSPVLMLDTLGIYGPRIWMLYKNVCGQDIGKTIALLRAWQLGLAGVSRQGLDHAIDNYGAGIEVDAVVEQVKTQLPNFRVGGVDKAEGEVSEVEASKAEAR